MTLRTTRPDNGAYPSQTISSDVDLAEAVARLSINRMRRNGRVIYMDDFTTLAGWTQTLCTLVATFSGKECYSPPTMCKMTPTIPLNVATLVKSLPVMLNNSNIGLEFEFFFTIDTLPNMLDQVDIQIFSRRGGGKSRHGTLRLEFGPAITFKIEDVAAHFVQFGAQITGNFQGWHNLKMICDFDNGKYRSFAFDEFSYDLSAYNLVAGIDGYETWIKITVTDTGAPAASLCIDDVIITTDEV